MARSKHATPNYIAEGAGQESPLGVTYPTHEAYMGLPFYFLFLYIKIIHISKIYIYAYIYIYIYDNAYIKRE